jgi:UDP-N-acetylglucosamine 4,6-dehydratase
MKKYVILGGTGTLGKEITRQLADQVDTEVVIFSRGELAQKQMAEEFRKYKNLRFKIGDIRDFDSVLAVCRDAHTVFHVAALKHVDTLELNPEESVKTNIIGTINVANACIQARVMFCAFSSTDKAVEPVNAYGMCKGVSEKILFQKNREQTTTRFSVFRWGNVASSRGSVLPVFVSAIKKGDEVPITDFKMTRFWIKIQDAVAFMLASYRGAKTDAAMIPPIKSAPLMEVVSVLGEHIGSLPRTKKIPIRPGEKLHESLDIGFRSDGDEHRFSRPELLEFMREFV